ncbi:MAG TPA: hypothetical protein ENK02_00820, partial [Planctomycetes bacterium]|nr:hypothetical protein [Planctomycetota bacterium]
MYKPTFLAFTTFAFVLPLSNGRTQKPIVLRSNAGFVGRVSIGAVLTGPSAKYVPAKYLVLKGIDTKAKRSFTGMRYFATTSKVLDNSEKQSAIDLSVGGFLCFGGSSSIRDYAQ